MTDVVALTEVSDPGLVRVEALLRATRLRNVLRVNAADSGVSGLVAAGAAGSLGDLVGVPSTAARVVGVGLVVFAIGVAAASGARHRRLPVLARLIGIADAGSGKAWCSGLSSADGTSSAGPAATCSTARGVPRSRPRSSPPREVATPRPDRSLSPPHAAATSARPVATAKRRRTTPREPCDGGQAFGL